MNKDGRRRASDYVLGAARIGAQVASKPGDPLNGSDQRLADSWLEAATRPLDSGLPMVLGGELMPVCEDADMDTALGAIKNTVEEASYITADASRDRIQLAHEAGALETGLDLADTIQAGNSLEKMLAHQLAATHRSTMKLHAQLNRCIENMDQPHRPDAQERANVQGTRLAGSIARLNGSFQSGLLTLQKMRSGGKQVVQVVHQHVAVSEGGQAVVAGNLEGGGRRRRKDRGQIENG